MIYSKNISTPITLYATIPLRTVLKVSKGLVYKVEIDFPPGPRGTLSVQIFDGGYQVWPSTPGESFCSDHYAISFDDTFLKLIEPFQFDIYTWNTADDYSHSVTVRVGMVSSELYMARFLPSYGYQELRRVIAEETALQEEIKKSVIEQPFSWMKETE